MRAHRTRIILKQAPPTGVRLPKYYLILLLLLAHKLYIIYLYTRVCVRVTVNYVKS